MKITSKRLSALRTLTTKKGRKKHKAFLVSGIRVIDEALKTGKAVLYFAMAPSELTSHGRDFLDKLVDHEIYEISARDLRRIDESQSSQGIVAVVTGLPVLADARGLRSGQVLALDAVSDPSNLGAIIRSAIAFNFEEVILGEGCTEFQSPRVVRASAGALFRIKSLVEGDLQEEMPRLKSQGYRVIGTDPHGTALEKATRKTARLCLVIGNEAHGISPAVTAWCDDMVRIPISEACESLSAPVAAAIAMYEVSKRQVTRRTRRNIRRH